MTVSLPNNRGIVEEFRVYAEENCAGVQVYNGRGQKTVTYNKAWSGGHCPAGSHRQVDFIFSLQNCSTTNVVLYRIP